MNIRRVIAGLMLFSAFSQHASAQNNKSASFCNDLRQLEKESASGFTQINEYTDDISEMHYYVSLWYNTKYYTTRKKLPGFDHCYILGYTSGITGLFGDRDTYVAVSKITSPPDRLNKVVSEKVTALKTKIVGCLGDYSVKRETKQVKEGLFSGNAWYEKYSFTKKKQAGNNAPSFILELRQGSKTSDEQVVKLVFYIGGTDTSAGPKTVTATSATGTMKQKTIPEALQELLKHARTKFDSIRGEKIQPESKLRGPSKGTYVYQTTYLLPGSIRSRINESFYVTQAFNYTEYASLFLEEAGESDVNKKFDELSAIIKKGLGDSFTYKDDFTDYTKKNRILSIRPLYSSDHAIYLQVVYAASGKEDKRDLYIFVR